MVKHRYACRLLCAVLASTVGAAVFVMPQHVHADGWEVSLSPFVWALGMDGSIGVRGNNVDIDASFGDILDTADSVVAFNSDISVRKDRFGLQLSPSYSKLGVDDVAQGTLLQSDATAELFFIDVAASYRFVDRPARAMHGGPGGSFALDGYAGVRYTAIESRLDFVNGGSPSGKKDWWDPVVGAQSNIGLTERWFFDLRGDVGGFGAGSDFSALGAVAIGYRFDMFGRRATAQAGYRALYQDYTEGSGANRFEWDMTLHGPTLGMTVYWD